MAFRNGFLGAVALSTSLFAGLRLEAASYRIGGFDIALDGRNWQIMLPERPDRPVWSRIAEESWLQVGVVDLTIRGEQGSFEFRTANARLCRVVGEPQLLGESANELSFAWDLTGDAVCQNQQLTMRFAAVAEGRLSFRFETGNPLNYIELRGRSSGNEAFYGFGLQPTFLDLKGRNVPIVVQEQGITRGRQPFTSIVNAAERGAAGTTVSSYMAAPQFITNQNRGLFLKNTEYAEIDLRSPNQIGLKLYAGTMEGEFLFGERPLDLVERYTAYAGRMEPLPDWFHRGAIVGLQGGTNKVQSIWNELQRRGTPVAGLWLQDWVGRRVTEIGSQLWWNWELDTDFYPSWDAFTRELRSRDVRVLGYINPHLVDVAGQKTNARRNLLAEARAGGYLLKDSSGNDYSIRLTAFDTGMVDLSLPAARTWLKEVIKDELIASGLSGWMCDFGEAIPFDAKNAAGIDGRSYHNQYAVEWARLNREAIEEAGLDDEIVFFCRAGYTTSPRYARLFWQGDQMVTWDANDGLKSAITGLIGGGLSGYSLNHSDIGGYTTLARSRVGLRRERDLLYRWMEVNAFTPAFRSHEGNLPQENVQVYSDADTYSQFDRNARIFSSLFFYRQQLFQEAAARGYPVVRALFLEFPDEARSYRISDQFMLGSEILVAPIVEKEARSRSLYLPPGEWVHVWTGQEFVSPIGGRDIEIAAPIGRIPAFYKKGSPVGERWMKELVAAGVSLTR